MTKCWEKVRKTFTVLKKDKSFEAQEKNIKRQVEKETMTQQEF